MKKKILSSLLIGAFVFGVGAGNVEVSASSLDKVKETKEKYDLVTNNGYVYTIEAQLDKVKETKEKYDKAKDKFDKAQDMFGKNKSDGDNSNRPEPPKDANGNPMAPPNGDNSNRPEPPKDANGNPMAPPNGNHQEK